MAKYYTETTRDFFKPLTGKNAVIIEKSVVALYAATFSHDFVAEDILDRKTVQDIILRVVQLEPWQDEEDAVLSGDAEKTAYIIKKLEKYSWIEFSTSGGFNVKYFSFTRNGKQMAQQLYMNANDDSSSNQRNVRSTRSSLESFDKDGDVSVLMDAYSYSAYIVSDLTDNINDIREDTNKLLSLASESIEKAGEDFVNFFSFRFDNIAHRMQEDSVRQNKQGINKAINSIKRNKNSDIINEKIKKVFPKYKDIDNPFEKILFAIESRVDVACDVKIPQLTEEASSYVLYGRNIIQKTNALAANSNKRYEKFALFLKGQEDKDKEKILENIGRKIEEVSLRIIDTSTIEINSREKKSPELSFVEKRELTKEAYIRSQLEQAKIRALSFTSKEREEYINRYLKEFGVVSNEAFEVETPKDLLITLYMADIGNTNKKDYVVRKGTKRISNRFFEDDEIIIERKKR